MGRSGYSRRLSLITTCVGRWYHLREAVRTWCRSLYPSLELIVVSSDEDAMQLSHGSLMPGALVRVSSNLFRGGYLRNLGARVSSGEYLGFVDADAVMRDDWPTVCAEMLQRCDLVLDSRLAAGLPSGSTSGTHCIQRWLFERIRGYNENLDASWGYEDTDLYVRAQQAGGDVGGYPVEIIHSIGHSDADRQFRHADDSRAARTPQLTAKKIRISSGDMWLHPFEANRIRRMSYPKDRVEVVRFHG